MTRKKTSIIWRIEYKYLSNIIRKEKTFSNILKRLKLNHEGGNVKTLKTRLDSDRINYNHIKQGIKSCLGQKSKKKKIPLNNILTKNSFYSRNYLKRRLLEEGLIVNKCSICSLGGVWNNKKLIMVLDHKNGIPNDNRLSNLRMICPNCNSQTLTFAGRNVKKK